jgi:hypothetical protein
MPLSLPALRSELQSDPRAYGYAPLIDAGADGSLADLLNLVRPEISVRRADIAGAELLEAVDIRDFVASPTAGALAWFESATQQPAIRLVDDAGANTRVLANLRRLLQDTNGSQTRLGQIANRAGSRAEELFGAGVVVAPLDIARALRP